MGSAPAWRFCDLDRNWLACNGFEEGLVVCRGALAIGVSGVWGALRTPAADAFVDGIYEGDLVTGAAAVLGADDLSHQFNQLIHVTMAIGDQVLAELERTAAGTPPLVHQLDDGSAIEHRLFFGKEVGKEFADGSRIGHA